MLFILYWNDCHPLDISEHCVSLALIQVNWVGHVKQLLKIVKRKTQSPRCLYSGYSVFKIPIRIASILFRKELVHSFCLEKLLGTFCYDIYNIHLGKLLESYQNNYDQLSGHEVITH